MPFTPNPITLIADARVIKGRLRFEAATEIEVDFIGDKGKVAPQLRIINGFRSNGVDKIAIDDDEQDKAGVWDLQFTEDKPNIDPGSRERDRDGDGDKQLYKAKLIFHGGALERRMETVENMPADLRLTKRQARVRALYYAFIEGDTVQLYVRSSQSKLIHALILQLGYCNRNAS